MYHAAILPALENQKCRFLFGAWKIVHTAPLKSYGYNIGVQRPIQIYPAENRKHDAWQPSIRPLRDSMPDVRHF